MLLRLLRAGLFEQRFYGFFEQRHGLKASEFGFIVCTIAAGKVCTILQ